MSTTAAQEQDQASVLAFETEMSRCAKERRALSTTISEKTEAKLCFETERIAHNALIKQELRADAERMKLIMKMRRATLRET